MLRWAWIVYIELHCFLFIGLSWDENWNYKLPRIIGEQSDEIVPRNWN